MSSTRTPAGSPLRRQRAAAFAEYLQHRGEIALDDHRFRLLRLEGWSRAETLQAVDDLTTAGVARLDRAGLCMVVSVPAAESEAAA